MNGELVMSHSIRLLRVAQFIVGLALFGVLILGASKSAQAAACTWTGASGADWGVAGNWSNCGGSTPSSGDTATIPNTANKPALASNVTIAGLNMQAGSNVNIGAGVQLAVNGATNLAAVSILGSGALQTNDLLLNPGCCFGAVSFSQDVSVLNSLVITQVQVINGARINVSGDVVSNDSDTSGTTVVRLVGAGDQSLKGSGILNNLNIAKPSGNVLIPTNFTLGAGGTLSGGPRPITGGLLTINSSYVFSYSGAIDKLNLNAGCCNAPVTLSRDLDVTTAFTVSQVQVINGNRINVSGDVVSNDSDTSGTTVVRLVGVGDQSLKGSGILNNLNIAKPSGNVLIPTNFTLGAGGTLSGGPRSITGGLLTINSSYVFSYSGAIDKLNLNAGCCNAPVTLSRDLDVTTAFTVSQVQVINGARINVSGDVVSNDSDTSGTTVVRLVGSGDQSLKGSGILNNLNIAKPSGNVLIPTNFTLGAGGTLSGGSRPITGGLLTINSSYVFSYSGAIDKLNLNAGCCNAPVTLSRDLDVTTAFTVSQVQVINGARINVSGDVVSNDSDTSGTTVVRLVGAGDQSLKGSGILNNLNIAKPSGNVLIPTNFTLGAGGTLSGGPRPITGGLLTINSSYVFSYSGAIDKLNLNAGCCNAPVTLSRDLDVTTAFTVSQVQVINGNRINVSGDVVSNDSDTSGTTVVRLVGAGDQSLKGSGILNNLNIAKPSGNVLIPTNFTLGAGGTLSGGPRPITGGLLTINSSYVFSYSGAIDKLNLNAGCCNAPVTLSRDLDVTTAFTVSQVQVINGARINVSGDVVSNDGDTSGTTVVRLVGAGDQSLKGSGILNNLNIAKPSGNVLIPTNFTLGAGGTLSGGPRPITGGLLTINSSYVFSYSGAIDKLNLNAGCCNAPVTLSRDLDVTTAFTVSQVQVINGARINVAGNVVSNDGDMAGTTFVRLNGGGDQTLSGAGIINNLEVAKSGGNVLFTGNRSFSIVNITSGLFTPNGFNVTSPVNVNGGVLGGVGKIIGAVTANNGGRINAGSSPGILGIQGNLALNAGSTLFLDVAGDTPGVQHDRVVVTGTVTINSAIITGATTTRPANPIIVLSNDAADAIAGSRFAGAPNNGDTVRIGNQNFAINYAGGTGNDLTLTTVNSAPVIAAITAQNIDELVQLALTVVANDPDAGQAISFSLEPGAPDGAAIDAGSGQFTWTPGEAQGPGVYTVTVRAADNGSPPLFDLESFQITVNEVNSAPTLGSISNQTVDEGVLLSLGIGASDGDLPAQSLSFSLDPGAPLGADINTSSGQFTWTPSEAQGPGVYPISVRVTDNGSPPLNATRIFTVTVNEVDEPPTAMNESDLALVDMPLAVSAPGVLANDFDTDSPLLSAVLVSGPSHGSLALALDGGFVYTPTQGFTGVDSFVYGVSDGVSVVNATMTIQVIQEGSPPGPIPLLQPGWHIFAYPVAGSRPVAQALSSINGSYSTVFGFEPTDPDNPWRMYDVTIPPPFDVILNTLTVLEYGRGYWINLTQPATLTFSSGVLASAATVTAAGADSFSTPPATYYGVTTAAVGARVEARINGALCGQAIAQRLPDGRVGYGIHVQAVSNSAPECGASGRMVDLQVAGETLATVAWNSDSAQVIGSLLPNEPTDPTEPTNPTQPEQQNRIYLPVITQR
jgi:hypothetical protein